MFQIVDLDTKRNRNREALNALKNEMSDSGEKDRDRMLSLPAVTARLGPKIQAVGIVD